MPRLSPLDVFPSRPNRAERSADDSVHRLVRIGRVIGDLEPAWGFEVGQPSAGWVATADVGTALVSAWLCEQDRQLCAGRMVAAAYLGWGLEYRLVNAVTAAMLMAPAAPLPSPEDTFLRVDACGHADAVRFRAAQAVPAVPGVGVEDRLAQALVATMAPVVAAVRSASGLPLARLWGMVADSVASTAVELGRRLGDDSIEHFWGRAQMVIEGLAAHGAHLRRRPCLVGLPPRPRRLVRGTCCRYYATQEACNGPLEQRWCSTCPAAPGNRGLPPATPRVAPADPVAAAATVPILT